MTYAHYRRTSGGTLPTIPDLWATARRLFDRALATFGAPEAIARQERLRRTARSEISAWFEPVERIVRRVIIAKAVIHLLMTPQGRKLLHASKRSVVASAPDKSKATPYKTTIPYPGWHTIYQPPQKPKPAPPPPPPPERTPTDRSDPASWSCPYRIVSMSAAPSLPVTTPKRRPLAVLSVARAREVQAAAPIPPARAKGCSAWLCARRIEMLRRVLDNPNRTILRVARYLARTSPDSVVVRHDLSLHTYRQGYPDVVQAREHAVLALRALHLSLNWLDRPDNDPG